MWKLDTLHGPATYYYSMGRSSLLLLLLRPVKLSWAEVDVWCFRIDEEVWEEDNKVSERRRK